MSQNSTQVLETLSPQEQADQIREQLDGLDDVWESLGVDENLRSAIINAAAKAAVDHLNPHRRQSHRRMSVLDRTGLVISKMNDAMERLNDLWDEIDMDENKRLARVNTAYGHVERLLSDMVTGEEAMVVGVKGAIEEFKTKVADMRREMGLNPFQQHLYKENSLKLWSALEEECTELREKRAKLIEEQKEVLDRFSLLSSRLGSDLSDETATSLPDQSVLAPRSTVAELKERCERMERMLEERMEKIVEAQREMKMWTERMGMEYDENVAVVLELDVNDSETTLTNGLVKEVDEMRERISSAYNDWVSEREFEYEEQLVKLKELWEKCLIPEEERTLPEKFDPADPSVNRASEELERLEREYGQKRKVYEAVGVWKGHWEEKMQLESTENSMDKYNNRGGALEQRIKLENRLNRQLLPAAAEAVAAAYNAFCLENEGVQIRIEGMEPLGYIQHVMSTHELEKEIEKEQKAQAKKAQLLQETKWGSTPAPNKALLGRRPLTTASASRVAAPAAKIARLGATGDAGHHLADFTFNQSVIPPVSPNKRGDRLFPKTSSPKGSRVTVPPGTRFASPSAKARAPLPKPFTPKNK